ncbi:MFS transporter [Paenibacillus sp. J5C_2022]|uniref:MDR family MFS transporter n=1 Tax=Paenibacillus sp. J5C2022 TaxID=2977129 RepID=UPI0021CE088E|nr:MDR family MFS transporter [Paenibacillus sp. J5C2022]MCU6709108.1 MFS transporter [Paenibacillus sp. J5C2022]
MDIGLDRRRKGLVLAGIMLGMLLSSLDTTIVSAALPRIAAALGGVEYVSWMFTAYMLATIISMPIFGKLADLYGRKRIFSIGIVLFMTGSVLCGLAQSMNSLILFRMLQGVAGGIISVNALAIVSDLFPPAERGRYQGLLGSVYALASVAGPILGGFIADQLSWRWIFYIHLPVGLIALAVVWLGMPAVGRRAGSKSIDYYGAALLIGSFVPLLLALSWGGSLYAWSSPLIIGLLGLFLLAFLLLIRVEAKAKEPIIPLRYFRNATFALSGLGSFIMAVAMFGTITYTPLFVQGVIGGSSADAGRLIMPMMLSVVVASIASGQLISRIGRYKWMTVAGFAVLLTGLLLLSQMDMETSTAYAAVNMAVTGAGIGLMMPIFVISAQNVFPQSESGTVTASVQFLRNIGGMVGVALLGMLLNSRLAGGDAAAAPAFVAAKLDSSGGGGLEGAEALFDGEYVASLKAGITAEEAVRLDDYLLGLRETLAASIGAIYTTTCIIAGVGLVLMLFLKDVPLRKK